MFPESEKEKFPKPTPPKDLTHIKPVIMDLINVENRKLAFELLDFYFKKAKTLLDYDVLGELALKAENRQMYLKCAEYAYSMAITPEQIHIARTNLYKAYNALNYPEKALFYVNLNEKIKPNDIDNIIHKAFTISLQNKKEECENIIESLIDKATNEKDIKNVEFALSGKMLREGKLKEGLLNFLDKFKEPSEVFHDMLKMKKWEGGIFPGKTIYVNGEGGIGDELINIRFFDHLKKLGMHPILYSSWNIYRPDTVELFRRHGHEVICEHYSVRKDQLWTHMMNIPGYLGLEEKDLWNGPYLKPLRQSKNELTSKKFKIGIKCSGNPYFSQDEYRCIPIESMLESLPVDHENVEIYYFDKEKSHPKCINMNDKLNAWDDTLDYLDQMDLIVSSCTSIVHAAGAIGKKTIVIVPIPEYYTWTSSRRDETTPWYGDNFKILKQTKVRSWKEPLDELKIIMKDIVEQIKE
jgi:hypothetical protein